ncbi:MAG: glyoxalase [Lachnospiraceae bacterium]|jgi:dsDNA-binding SOS-regulon protein|nr:glyoxalase [Lachnospiraceae bacterium]
MYEYEEECLEVFLANQKQLLGREEFMTKEEADAFLADCMACVCDSLQDVRDYLEEAGMDAYGMSDEELLAQSELFALSDGRFLVVEG